MGKDTLAKIEQLRKRQRTGIVKDGVPDTDNIRAGLLHSPSFQLRVKRFEAQRRRQIGRIMTYLDAVPGVGRKTEEVAQAIGLGHTMAWQYLKELEMDGLVRDVENQSNRSLWFSNRKVPG